MLREYYNRNLFLFLYIVLLSSFIYYKQIEEVVKHSWDYIVFNHTDQVAYNMDDATELMSKCLLVVREHHKCVPAITVREVADVK